MKEYVKSVAGIEELFLDPNNPRIVPLMKGKDTAVQDVKNEAVQATTLKLMYEEAGPGINDYYTRLQKEGLLSSFPLRVARLPGGGYVLNDGNTRIVAAKAILADHAVGKIKVSQDILNALKKVHVEDLGAYGGTEWLKMQSKIHLQGPRTWASSKRAGFIQKVLRKRLSKDETMDILQIRGDVISRYLHQLDAYFGMQAEFPERINENHFAVFKELMKAAGAKRYLGWNGKKKAFTNKGHVAQFLHLVSPQDGTKPKIMSNNGKDFRNLSDDPFAWDTMVRGTDKERKALLFGADKRRQDVNDVVVKLAGMLQKLAITDANNLDIEMVSRVISLLGRAKTQALALAKAGRTTAKA
jgi:hypothetical protein